MLEVEILIGGLFLVFVFYQLAKNREYEEKIKGLKGNIVILRKKQRWYDAYIYNRWYKRYRIRTC